MSSLSYADALQADTIVDSCGRIRLPICENNFNEKSNGSCLFLNRAVAGENIMM
jgi:hypothetical protein